MDRVQTQLHTHAYEPAPNVSAAEHAAMWHRFTKAATVAIVIVVALLSLMGIFLL